MRRRQWHLVRPGDRTIDPEFTEGLDQILTNGQGGWFITFQNEGAAFDAVTLDQQPHPVARQVDGRDQIARPLAALAEGCQPRQFGGVVHQEGPPDPVRMHQQRVIRGDGHRRPRAAGPAVEAHQLESLLPRCPQVEGPFGAAHFLEAAVEHLGAPIGEDIAKKQTGVGHGSKDPGRGGRESHDGRATGKRSSESATSRERFLLDGSFMNPAGAEAGGWIPGRSVQPSG